MKKIFIALAMLLPLVFSSCTMGICSPIVSFVEVLDSKGNSLKEVSFAISLDSKTLDDVTYYPTELTEEEYELACEDSNYLKKFKNGKYYYNLASTTFGDIITAGNDNITETVDDTFSRISITVSKNGYKSTSFTPSRYGDTDCSYQSITLESE